MTKLKKFRIVAIVFSVVLVLFCGCNANYYESTIRKSYSADDAIFNSSYATDNNGYDLKSSEVDRLISATPSKIQYDYSKLGYYNFIHFGMNTFTDREWGTGDESPELFNPTELDTDQWAKTLKDSGSKGIILTAKHHDGFCLWQSAYTTHSVKYSPYKDGKGDIVKELSESCKKYGLKFGVYLSPWDMHEETYGTNSYNDYFINQLTELCTNYGELFAVWFDGACGEDVSPDFKYDWERIYAVVRQYQPNAVMCVCGPDVRWIGNEAGVVRDSEWSVVPSGEQNTDKIQEASQKSSEDAKRLQNVNPSKDNGSRELLFGYDNVCWFPAEADVSIRSGWFYHKNQSPKTLEQLLSLYYKVVGGNASLLLNVPPDTRGLIAEKDVKILTKFGETISKDFTKPIDYTPYIGTPSSTKTLDELNALKSYTDYVDYDNKGVGSYMFNDNDYILDIKFDKEKQVSIIDLREDIRFSQRVEKFSVYLIKANGKYELVSNSTVIGSRNLIVLNKKKNNGAVGIRIVITQSRDLPVLDYVGVFE